MTPERAAELASELRNEWMHNGYHDMVGKLSKCILAACKEQKEQDAKMIPKSWLDPLLTGHAAVITDKSYCPEVEKLLSALQERIRSAE